MGDNMGQRIKQRRIEVGLTQEELAEKLGVQKSAVAKYENGRVENIKRSTIKKMADALQCSPSFLMDFDDDHLNKAECIRIPVYGAVAAGQPLGAAECILDYEEIPVTWSGDFAALKVEGNSMDPMIKDGDVLIVHMQSVADSGDIVVARINNENYTVKKLIQHENSIVLQPLNPEYEPIVFSSLSTDKLQIWGKVVQIRRNL